MKKLLGLFIFLLFILTGCNKEKIIHYNVAELNYRLLSQSADFVLKDQNGVLEYSQVASFNTEPAQYREATQDDKLKAIDLTYKMETLKNLLDEAADNCNKIRQLYKGKNIFNSHKRQQEIGLYTKFILDCESSMLKATDGITVATYLDQYVPKNLRSSNTLLKIK